MKLHFIFGVFLTGVAAVAAPPDFHEVYGIVQSNLAGLGEADLNEAALRGLLKEFPGRVSVEDYALATATNVAAKALGKATVFDGSFAYLRVRSVTPSLAEEIRQAWKNLSETNKIRLKGVALDLRFADGDDYAAASGAVDCFLSGEEPLLEWPGQKTESTKKADAISVPVTLIVDAKTSGAAEALAAALRATDRALAVGSKTADQAYVFKEFPLSNGQKLRVATAEVKFAGGPSLAGGLTPDIPVDSTPEDDKAYLDNPYKKLHIPEPAVVVTQTNAVVTNEAPVKFNEAELVREQKEAISGDAVQPVVQARAPEQAAPLIADPALARALDLLKGLSVMGAGKPG